MNPILRVIAKIHTTIYHRSKGRFGNQMGGTQILLLHHVGAKSGKKYTTPLGYINNNQEAGGAYIIVAAAAGQPKNPGWYYNLKKNPNTTIEIMGEQINVTAEVVSGEKRNKIWNQMSADFPQFIEFQKKTSRVIPIVLLHTHST
ncbi:MAG: nitroreductase family deazaflavin-dependent oxidoreductase [Chloroflexota bacterium]